MVLAGSITASANESKNNEYHMHIGMSLDPQTGQLNGLRIRIENYSGQTLKQDMDSVCQGLLKNEGSFALIPDFKSPENTDEENARLLPVPKILEFSCAES